MKEVQIRANLQPVLRQQAGIES